MGAALAAGKIKENRPIDGYDGRGRPVYQTFSAWVKESFPGICTKNEVDAAIWFFQEFPRNEEKFGELPAGLTYPRNIREWFNEQPKADEAPPFDLETPPVPQPPVLAPRDAEKVIKIIERADYGGEGSDIAAQHLKGIAKKHGLPDVATLREAAKCGAPASYFKLPSVGEVRGGSNEKAPRAKSLI